MSREFERLKERVCRIGFGFRKADEAERRRGWRYAVLWGRGRTLSGRQPAPDEVYAYASSYADVRFWLRGAPTVLRGVHKV